MYSLSPLIAVEYYGVTIKLSMHRVIVRLNVQYRKDQDLKYSLTLVNLGLVLGLH